MRLTFNSILKRLIRALIKFYRFSISPYLGQRCMYAPTCSAYALECFERFNIFYALRLVIKRLIKCNPWTGKFDHDPVPLKTQPQREILERTNRATKR